MNQNENPAPKRENFASRLGFLLVSAGCAIGIGNVWRFPTVAGQNGGGVFVLFYLIFLLAMGVPVLTMELAVGRAGHGTATQAYRALEKQGAKWHLHGYLCLFGCCMLMMYYTTVSGWMLSYFFKFLTGAFSGLSGDAVSGVFGRMLESPGEMGGYMALTVVLGFAICSFGLQNGVERITKGMMCALIVLIAVLAVHSFTLSGAKDGLAFFLLPDWGRAVEQGIGSVLVSAMNQAFFTLSLGIGAMAIFGSYIGKEHSLLGESVRIVVLDTFVAITAGLIIFPACFAFNVSPDSGPNLIFVTLPNIFNHMAGGRLWGSLFFVFMAFAAFSTVLAVFENIMSCCMDLTGWSRKKTAAINIVLMILLSLPCVLGFNVWSGFQPFGPGSNVLDLEDFLVSNLWLPLGSLVYLLFCTSRYGWGWKNFQNEANDGGGIKVRDGIRFYVSYILPLIVLVIFVLGIRDKFFA